MSGADEDLIIEACNRLAQVAHQINDNHHALSRKLESFNSRVTGLFNKMDRFESILAAREVGRENNNYVIVEALVDRLTR